MASHRRGARTTAGRPGKHTGVSREMTLASGNVFLDLGFAPGVAANLLLRSKLMIEAEKLIERRRLTQTAAAKLFGVSQPRVSDLHRGRIDRFSLDALVQLLARAGRRRRNGLPTEGPTTTWRLRVCTLLRAAHCVLAGR